MRWALVQRLTLVIAAVALAALVAGCGGDGDPTADSLGEEVCDLLGDFMTGLDSDEIESMDGDELADLAADLESRQVVLDEGLDAVDDRRAAAGITEPELSTAVVDQCPELAG